MTLPTSPRDIAVSALADRAGNVSAHLDRLLAAASLSPADRSLARELALGVVRRRATLEAVLRAYLARPGQPLPPALRHIMHVALYQILLLERIPAFAAVNEAVEQAVRGGFIGQKPLVNGVLRAVGRGVSAMQAGRPAVAGNVIPVGPASFRTIDRSVFADPAVDPQAYLAAAHSLPRELAERWVGRLGMEQAVEVATCCNAPAPMILRVNRLRADVSAAIAALAEEGVAAVPHVNGQSVVLAEHQNVAQLKALAAGLVQPQDPTATAVAMACDVQAGMEVLDFCAAPGTKTTHLAELMGNVGSIVAADVSDEKVRRIHDNARRLGVTIIQTMLAEQVGRTLRPGRFDRVLADVPCSNTGVLARRAEARWRVDARLVRALAKDQQFLAAAAALFVKPGGRLIYSTCSIEPEECSDVTRHLAKQNGRLKMIAEQLTLPGGAGDAASWHDGGYFAVFEVT